MSSSVHIKVKCSSNSIGHDARSHFITQRETMEREIMAEIIYVGVLAVVTVQLADYCDLELDRAATRQNTVTLNCISLSRKNKSVVSNII